MSKKSPAKPGNKSGKSTPEATEKRSGTIADRNDHRVPIQLLVDYKSDGHFLFDFCRDLGTGGVFIETTQPLPTGSKIDLTFTIPDSKETLKTSGTVIWSQGPVPFRSDVNVGMGVQFSKFNDAQRKTLDQFVSRYGGSNGGNPTQRKVS
jgi:uncharacterized protein (TIGR02266 family)